MDANSAGHRGRFRVRLRTAVAAVVVLAGLLALARPYLREPWDWVARRAWVWAHQRDLDRHVEGGPPFASKFARAWRADPEAGRAMMTATFRRRLSSGEAAARVAEAFRTGPQPVLVWGSMSLDPHQGFVSTMIFRRDGDGGPAEVFKLTIVTESGTLKAAEIVRGTPEDAAIPE